MSVVVKHFTDWSTRVTWFMHEPCVTCMTTTNQETMCYSTVGYSVSQLLLAGAPANHNALDKFVTGSNAG